ncbi:hypothetical protein MY1884_009632 [Beauveria asiatica]
MKRKRLSVGSDNIGRQSQTDFENSAALSDATYNRCDFSVILNRTSTPAQGSSSDTPVPNTYSQQFRQYQPVATAVSLHAESSPDVNSRPYFFEETVSSYPFSFGPQAGTLSASASMGATTEELWHHNAPELQPLTDLGGVAITATELVCFGVVGEIAGKCEPPPSANLSAMIEVTIDSPETFSVPSFPGLKGHIATGHSFLLRDILISELCLRVSCNFENTSRGKQDAARKRQLLSCQLSIAIYAPFFILKEIKEWSEFNEVYLQDPAFCLQDARYCNPQRLSLHFDPPRMVSQVISQLSEHKTLPPRYNKEYPVDFTTRERDEYNLIRDGATSAIDDALQGAHGSRQSVAYPNIL